MKFLILFFSLLLFGACEQLTESTTESQEFNSISGRWSGANDDTTFQIAFVVSQESSHFSGSGRFILRVWYGIEIKGLIVNQDVSFNTLSNQMPTLSFIGKLTSTDIIVGKVICWSGEQFNIRLFRE